MTLMKSDYRRRINEVRQYACRSARVLPFAVLAACAPATSLSFEKPGMTENEITRDQNECFALALDGTSQKYAGLIRVDRDSYRRCMEQRGYTSRVTSQ